MIVLQHSAQALPTLHRSIRLGGRLVSEDQLVVESLMVAFEMIVGDELLDRPVQRSLSEENHTVQASFFDATHEVFGIGV